MCIYLCMYVYIYGCMYLFMYVCMYVYIYGCMYLFMYLCVYICIMYVYTCLHVCKLVLQIPSWQLQLRSANQEIPLNLCKPTVRYRVHNSRLLVPIMNDINLYHIYPSPIFQLCLISFYHLPVTFIVFSYPTFPHHNPICTPPFPQPCQMFRPLILFNLPQQ